MSAANAPSRETELVEAAIAWLRERLPASWQVERGRRSAPNAASAYEDFIELTAPNGTYATLAVEARASLEPREVPALMPGLARSLRALANFVPLLVVAPWLSQRTQELLAADDLNYLDLTGNARVRLDNPAVFIQSAGASRNPAPAPRARASIHGTRAARLVRLLADVRPPYGVGELAEAAGLTPGYVSRLLESLDRDALIERGRRGGVESVDVPALLRAWADGYDVLRRGRATGYVAPAGATTVLMQLSQAAGRVLVTGSFAAARVAAVAAPALLMAYCDDVPAVASGLGLLPADEGANVTLLRPFDPVVWERGTRADGVDYCALSQVVVDCLTGTGRMPAEGEALLAWMADHEDQWRAKRVPDRRAQ